MLTFADWVLHLLHVLVVGLNVFGWMWSRTRKLSMILLAATALSWSLLGALYGFGFSPLTALHWKIKAAQGVEKLPDSYFVYLLQEVGGFKVNVPFVDGMAAGVLFMCIVAALFVHFRLRKS